MHLLRPPWTHQPPPGHSLPNAEHVCFPMLRGLYVAAPTGRQVDTYGAASIGNYPATHVLTTDGWAASASSINTLGFPLRESWPFQEGITLVVRVAFITNVTATIWGGFGDTYGSHLRQIASSDGTVSLGIRIPSSTIVPAVAERLPLNTFLNVVVKDGANLTEGQIWVNGVLLVTYPKYEPIYSNYSVYGRIYDGHPNTRISMGAAFRGLLADEECRLLSLNPWELLQPVQRRIVFPADTAPESAFWANVGGAPTRALGIRAWNGDSFITPSVRRWNGTEWTTLQ